MQVTQTDGTLRQAKPEDFDNIVATPQYTAARELAKEMFPDDWQLVMAERQTVLNVNNKRVEALDKFRKEGGERAKAMQEQQAAKSKAIMEAAAKHWKAYAVDPVEKFPQFFKPIEGDGKGNELLEKGWKESAAAFENMNIMDPRLSDEQREKVVEQHATMFNKAAAFNRLAYQLQMEKKKAKDLEAKLKAYEESEPKDVNGHARKAAAPAESVTDRLQKWAT
jgi:hypothetical protein